MQSNVQKIIWNMIVIFISIVLFACLIYFQVQLALQAYSLVEAIVLTVFDTSLFLLVIFATSSSIKAIKEIAREETPKENTTEE
jgi:hypothetical protein